MSHNLLFILSSTLSTPSLIFHSSSSSFFTLRFFPSCIQQSSKYSLAYPAHSSADIPLQVFSENQTTHPPPPPPPPPPSSGNSFYQAYKTDAPVQNNLRNKRIISSPTEFATQIQLDSNRKQTKAGVEVRRKRQGRQQNRQQLASGGSSPSHKSWSPSIQRSKQLARDISACKANGDIDTALRLLEQTGNDPDSKYAVSVFAINAALSVCNEARKYKDAKLIMDRIESGFYGFPPDIVTYNTYLNLCLNTGNQDHALKLFDKLSRAARSKLNPPTVMQDENTTNSQSISDLDPNPALTDSPLVPENQNRNNQNEEPVDPNLPIPNVVTYNTMIAISNARKKFDRALNYMQEMKDLGITPDLISYNSAIHACAGAKRPEKALALLDELLQNGLQPKVVTFSSCINACEKKLGWHEQAMALLNRMTTEFELQPNVITYATCISVCAKNAQADQAIAILEQMKKKKIQPNVVAYAAAMTACANQYRWQDAIMLLDNMKKDNIRPDIVCFNACMTACEKSGQWRKALALLDKAASIGLTPDHVSYAACISALEKDFQAKKARQLLDTMKHLNCKPDVVCYSACISACAKEGLHEDALELLEEMKKEGITPNVITYSSCINACEKAGYWEKATDLLYEMKKENMQPNIITYNTAISACEKAGRWRKALSLFEEMRVFGLKADVVTYSSVISALGKGDQYERALRFLDQMKKEQITPNAHTYSAVITACDKGGQWEKCLDLLRETRKLRIPPNRVIYTACIKAVGEAGRHRVALELLHEMRTSISKPKSSQGNQENQAIDSSTGDDASISLSLDNIAYSACISACEKAEDWQNIALLLEEMKQDGIPPTDTCYRLSLRAFRRAGTKAAGLYRKYEKEARKLGVFGNSRNRNREETIDEADE